MGRRCLDDVVAEFYEEEKKLNHERKHDLSYARDQVEAWAIVCEKFDNEKFSAQIDELESYIREEVDEQWPGGRVEFDRAARTAVAIHPLRVSFNLRTGETKDI